MKTGFARLKTGGVMYKLSKIMRSMLACATIASIASTIGVSTASARTLAEIQKSGVMNVAATAADPPHGFYDSKTKKFEGIMPDITRAIAKHLGVEAKLNNVQFDGLIPSLQANRADFSSGALFITEKRAEQVDFTVPIYGWGDGIVMPEKSKDSFKQFDDLRGKTVGTLVSSVQYDMLKQLEGTNVKSYSDYPSLVLDIQSGRLDAGFVDPPNIRYIISSHNISGVKAADEYVPKNHWQVAATVQKGNTELLDAVNNILIEMKKSGELKAILDKWGVADMEEPL